MPTLSAALPGAALRMTRTAAGRRALQVGLLVGGLFVLGMLCGARAGAADGATSGVTATGVVRSVTGSAERVVTGSVGAVARGAEQWRAERPGSEQRSATAETSRAGAAGAETSGAATPGAHGSGASDGIRLDGIGLDGLAGLSEAASETEATPGAASGSGAGSEPGVETPARPRTVAPLDPVHKVTAPLADPVTVGVHRVVRPVTERVVRPVTEQVIRPVTDGVVRPIGGLVEQVVGGGVAKPEAPASPWWPPRAVLPGLELPALPHLPGLPVMPGETLPVGSQPQLPGGAADVNGSAGQDAGEKSGARSTGAYGPRFSGGHVTPDAGASDDEVARHPAQPPAHQEHEGAPRGALGHGSAADNGSPRHGDAHAVAFSNRAQLKLVPGITAAVTAAETRDRYRDIPVFPG
ncbi:hypothetical protein ACFPH6_39590 [Streptomyces xiangluensis]|uniref:Secreted protein n=1 Tax=Streptomyces xiangluensis TaxID=2665720 RepID=A0ABV8YZ38_9ACTN